MPLIAKVLLLALKTKRGRELLFAGGLGVIELARGKRAHALYARARDVAANSQPRAKVGDLARRAAARVKQ